MLSVRGGEPSICQLPLGVRLGGALVTQRIPLRMSVHRVALGPHAASLVVITSRNAPYRCGASALWVVPQVVLPIERWWHIACCRVSME